MNVGHPIISSQNITAPGPQNSTRRFTEVYPANLLIRTPHIMHYATAEDTKLLRHGSVKYFMHIPLLVPTDSNDNTRVVQGNRTKVIGNVWPMTMIVIMKIIAEGDPRDSRQTKGSKFRIGEKEMRWISPLMSLKELVTVWLDQLWLGNNRFVYFIN